MKNILDRYYIYEITSDNKKYYTLALSEEGAKILFLGNIDSVKLYSPVPVNIDDDEFRLYHNYNIYEVKFSYDCTITYRNDNKTNCYTSNNMIYIATDDIEINNITNNVTKFINKNNEHKIKKYSRIKIESINFQHLNIKSIKLILSGVKGIYKEYINYNVENNVNDYIYYDMYKVLYHFELSKINDYEAYTSESYILINDIRNIEPYINSEYDSLNLYSYSVAYIECDTIEHINKILCRKDNLNASKIFKITYDLNISSTTISVINAVEYVLADDSDSAISIFRNFNRFKHYDNENIMIKQINFSVYNNVITAI